MRDRLYTGKGYQIRITSHQPAIPESDADGFRICELQLLPTMFSLEYLVQLFPEVSTVCIFSNQDVEAESSDHETHRRRTGTAAYIPENAFVQLESTETRSFDARFEGATKIDLED